MIVYISGQMRFFEHGRHFIKSRLLPALQGAGADVLPSAVPWEGRPASTNGGSNELDEGALWEARNSELESDPLTQIEGADVVVVVLNGDEPKEQTLLELGFANAKGKLLLGFWDDIRRDPHCELCPVNPLAEHLIAKSGGGIHSTLQGLAEALARGRVH